MTDELALAVYLGMILLLVAVIVALAGRLAPRAPNPAKLRPYECGVSEPMATETRWPVHFALVAMLFLVFDVEVVFFYPWAVLVRELKWQGMLAMSTFFVVLGAGYLYALGKGAFKWR